MVLKFPTIYLIGSFLSLEKLHELEKELHDRGCLTYNIREAQVVIGNLRQPQRAKFELQVLKLYTEAVKQGISEQGHGSERCGQRKRKRVDVQADGKEIISLDSSTESESEERENSVHGSSPQMHIIASPRIPGFSSPLSTDEIQQTIDWGDTIKVLEIEWYTESVKADVLLPPQKYLVYEGRPIPKPIDSSPLSPPTRLLPRAEIMARVEADTHESARVQPSYASHKRTRPQHQTQNGRRLVHETTSEHNAVEDLPPLPSWLRSMYSCQRCTPAHSPNDPFIDELKKIRKARILRGEDKSALAYSRIIAALAAYPYSFTSAREVQGLPYCNNKAAFLFQEWKETGRLKEADQAESDPEFQVLSLFYEIWAVAEVTAMEFYRKGWRDLDDIVENGWHGLSRTQQIGVKFYEEFQEKIPRAEVERIGNTILKYACRIREGFQMVIVGGYRRGKEASGDVDVVLSHPDENATMGFVQEIVVALERDQWITHTLEVSTANSSRGQNPVSWKGAGAKSGSGFDTLDKALVVWQEKWTTEGEDLKRDAAAKNPNVHRRVDIVISPWKTAGCAVVGWSGGTTFQRDLRKYAKKKMGLKFDSSGVRKQSDGTWIPLEEGGRDLLEKEKMVFAGLGLEWREPSERCTG
ncbi:hypothetical protein B7494_g3953 [Chlorociboria aeruginascens]|nr:hypothetical protein B7494_g3953 [Chlorociboria aeruginascens]